MHKTGTLKKFQIPNMGQLFRVQRGGSRLIEEGLESEAASMKGDTTSVKETVSLSGDLAQAKATEAADEGEEIKKAEPFSQDEKEDIAEQTV